MAQERLKEALVIVLILCLVKLGLYYGHFTFHDLRLFGFSKSADAIALFPLRISAAFVFVWYGLNHLTSSAEFNGMGNKIFQLLGVQKPVNLALDAKIWGMFELLVATALVLGFYLDVAALVASLLLLIIILLYYFLYKSFLFRDVAIFGATLTLLLLTMQ